MQLWNIKRYSLRISIERRRCALHYDKFICQMIYWWQIYFAILMVSATAFTIELKNSFTRAYKLKFQYRFTAFRKRSSFYRWNFTRAIRSNSDPLIARSRRLRFRNYLLSLSLLEEQNEISLSDAEERGRGNRHEIPLCATRSFPRRRTRNHGTWSSLKLRARSDAALRAAVRISGSR